MKAIRVSAAGGPEVLRVEEVQDPRPQAGQVVVRVKAAGVNPVDTYVRAGWYGPMQYPYTPGIDAAGIIESVGPDVTDWTPGDRAYTAGTVSGAYADLALCSASQVHCLPERLSFAQGAGVNVPYATAYRALFIRAHGIPAETVLVHGATGGVGIAAVQIAKAAGFRVIGTGGTEEGRKLVEEQGADCVLDHHAPGYLEKVKECTGGQGANIILEMLANVNLDKDLDYLAPGGRVVVIGSRGPIEIDPRKTMSLESAILGCRLPSASERELRVIHSAVGAGLANGSLVPIVRVELPLADAPEGHQMVMAPGAFGKIVLLP